MSALPAYSMNTPYPARKKLDHRGPLSIRTTDAIYFVTIAAAERGTTELADRANVILSAARFYQTTAKWFLYLFIVMPDHIHMLVHVPQERTLADVVGHWKSYLTTQHGIRLQAKGLVATPREWPHSVAFDRSTGQERKHR